MAGLPSQQALPILPDQLVGRIGQLTPALLAYASDLLGQMPSSLMTLAHEPSSARAIIFALLLSRDTDTRRRQFKVLQDSGENWLSSETLEASPQVDRCPLHARLPLVDLSLSALRELSETQYGDFMQLVDQLVDADQEVDLFEYTLIHVLKRHLTPTFKTPAPPVVRYRSLDPLREEVSLLLSLLAAVGHEEDPKEAETAFQRGLEHLEEPKPQIPFQASLEWGSADMGKALDRLTLASPQLKKSILKASSGSVTHDGVVTPRERELLRAIADSFDCPIPPFE